ncbi:hypothetical protein H0H87_006988 [Tephrocybe sp. NHM501043]|nr:hypothetical protein H0H87_006988 [Tephrocybe sp. NHM501043]
MSRSRRGRMLNLNTLVESTRTPFGPTRTQPQLSTPQMTAAAMVHYEQTANRMVNVGAVSHPATGMAIQYGTPHANHANLAIGHNGVPHQFRQSPSQVSTSAHLISPPTQATPPTRMLPTITTNFERATPTSDADIDRLMTAITPIINAHQESVTAEIKKFGDVLEKLSADNKEAQDSFQKQLLKLTGVMREAYVQQQAKTKEMDTRVESLESLIKAGFDRSDPGSLMSRMENVQYSVGELSERVKDPGATDFITAERDSNPALFGIDTHIVLESPTGHSTIPTRLLHEEKSTSSEYVEPVPVERTSIPVRPIYIDAGSDALNLETDRPLQSRSVAANVVQPEFKSVGNNLRTPPHPRQLQTVSSTGSSSLLCTPSRLTFSDFHQLNATTLLGNGGTPPTDTDDATLSPRLKRKQIKTTSNEDKGDLSFAADDTMSVDGTGNIVASSSESSHMGADNDGKYTIVLQFGHKITAHIAVQEDVHMDNELETDSPIQARTHRLSTSSSQLREGSIASLRQTVLAHSPAPSPKLPSLPSPATTPSAQPSPGPSGYFEHKSSSPPIASITTPCRLQKRPTLIVSSPSSGSSPERNAPPPALARAASTTTSALRTPALKPPQIASIVPISEVGSELSMSRLVNAPSSEELSMSPVVPDPEPYPVVQDMLSPTPLFLPESRSQSPPAPSFDDPPFSPPPASSPPPNLTRAPWKNPRVPVSKAASKGPLTILSSDNQRSLRDPSMSIQQSPANSRQTSHSASQTSTHFAAPPPEPQTKPIVVNSSPIYVSSRSPSPLSDLSSDESDSDSGSDAVRIVRKKKTNRETKIKRGSITTQSTSTLVGTSANVRRFDLSQKIKAKAGTSAAVTRVKKRKALSTEEMEPPLKRARQKADVGAEARVKRERKSVNGPSSKGKEKEKEDQDYRVKNKDKSGSTSKEAKKLRPRAAPAPPTRCKWPAKNTSGDKKFDHQFIECEKCFTWYHYGCVGITDIHDPIVKDEASFKCPPCAGGGASRYPLISSSSIVCGRPDCVQEQVQPDEYFMTAILGRHTKVQGGMGRKYMWLVKWDGYSIKDCTWEEEDAMSDPLSFIQDFYVRSLKEGKNAEEDPHSTFILREAIAGGWKDPNADCV